MNCSSNAGQLAATYEDLINTAYPADTCIPWRGSPPKMLPDSNPADVSTWQRNACRQMLEPNYGPFADRRSFVEGRIFQKGYNTNYTASWFLVRGGVSLTVDGNPKLRAGGCAAPFDLRNRDYCLGPLKQQLLDSSKAPAMLVPLLGDGALAGVSSVGIDRVQAGTPTTRSMTGGPRFKTTSGADYGFPSGFASGTPRNGPGGWWKVWNRDVLQDYRDFQTVHRGAANILFADGSVRTYTDTSDDGQLNNGFVASGTGGGFNNNELELKPEEIFSLYSLDGFREN